MPKIITSPVKRWPGTVTLLDPIPFPAYNAWTDAIEAAQVKKENLTTLDAAIIPELAQALLPGIMAMVIKWDLAGLENVTVATFPAAPRQPSIRLLVWLIGEIVTLVNAEDADPKN
jgi:hypothetical protein